MTRAAALVLPLVLTLSAAAAPAAESVTDGKATLVVERLHEALLGVMRDARELGYEGRYERLRPVLTEVFDIPFMAEKSVGRHWKEFDDANRKRLLDTFGRFTVANYAGRFDGYDGQHFETLGEETSTRGTVLVRSQLVDPEGEIVQLNYRLRPVDGHWKIIDVYLNGTVSELALRRSEYSSLIKREGFPALIAALDERITELSTTPADQAS